MAKRKKKKNKGLKIFIVLILLAALGAFAYFYFFQDKNILDNFKKGKEPVKKLNIIDEDSKERPIAVMLLDLIIVVYKMLIWFMK